MAPSPIAIAADYADAMLTARRAKNSLVAIIVVILLLQLGLCFAVRYVQSFQEALKAGPDATAVAGSAATAASTAPSAKVAFHQQALHYLVALSGFAGIVCALVLVGVLALLVQIMLVGRLIGVAQVTQALIWSMLLVVLLFPWQAFLNNANMTAKEFKIPGVLYTWEELVNDGGFSATDLSAAILKWARFVGWPVVALAILLVMIQLKTSRGLGMALGEIPVDVVAPPGIQDVPPSTES